MTIHRLKTPTEIKFIRELLKITIYITINHAFWRNTNYVFDKSDVHLFH